MQLEWVGDSNHSSSTAHEVLDASGGYASACLGANHPVIAQSLSTALKCGYATDEIDDAARQTFLELLFGEAGLWIEHFPFGRYHVAGRNSGSEGMELALRLLAEARYDYRHQKLREGFQERNVVLAFEGAWHGWTAGLVPLLNRRHYRVGLVPQPETAAYGLTVQHVPFGDFSALEQFFAASGDHLLGVIVEPVQGDAGILCPPPTYLRELARMTRRAGALLVADEVLTFAKSGQFFAMRDGEGPIQTDITVIGKSLGLGVMSVSLVIARRDLTVRATGAVCTSDLRPIACHVMADGCRYLNASGLVTDAKVRGELLRNLLREKLSTRFSQVYGEVRGIGLLNGVELTADVAPYVGDLRVAMIRAGVYVEAMAGAGQRSSGLRYVYPTLRFAPPLVTSEEQIRELVDRAASATLAVVEKQL
jgi:acetylornithine/succinyldiaminopimelate/putrescine aminotransferase